LAADALSVDRNERVKWDRPEEAVKFRGSWSGYERDCLFHNPDGPGRKFYNSAWAYGLDFDDDGRSAAPVDFDGDGDLDLVLLSLQGLRLMENRMPRRNFARLRLTATKTHPTALNAMVRLSAGGVTQQDYVKITDGFLTQVPLDLHFGLAGADKVDRILVRWPSGATQEFTNLPADRLIELTEGAETAKTSELPRWPEGSLPKETPSFRFDAALPKLDGGTGAAVEKGSPAVINFWSPSCAPCKEELPGLARVAEALKGEAQFAGISTETKDLDAVKAMVAAVGLKYPQFLATPEVLTSFFPEGGAILPSTFVLDPSGRVRRVFRRPVTESEIADLLATFRGESLQARDLVLRAGTLLESGQNAAALEVARKALEADPGMASPWARVAAALAGKAEEILAEARNSEELREAERRAAPVWDEVISHLKKALEIEPDWAESRYNLGIALHRRGRYEEAMKEYQESIRIRGDQYDALASLGLAAGAAGKDEVALDAFERALKIDSKSSDAWLAKATLHAKRGQPDEARKCVQKALEHEPANDRAKAMLESLNRR
jgi:tetratricopeptide (TPR) repeat protein